MKLDHSNFQPNTFFGFINLMHSLTYNDFVPQDRVCKVGVVNDVDPICFESFVLNIKWDQVMSTDMDMLYENDT